MLRKGKTVTPASGVKETGTNVATLKHFFPCTETSGTRLTDTKGGLVWDLAGSGFTLTFNSTLRTIKTDSTFTDAPILLTSGTWTPITIGKHYLFMAVGRVLGDQGCRVAIGDINGFIDLEQKGWGLSDGGITGVGTFHSAIGNSTGMFVRSVAAGTELCTSATGVDVVTYGYYIADTSLEYKSLVVSTSGNQLLTDTNTSVTHPGTFTPYPCMRTSGYDLYGFAIFEFSSQPADLYTGIKWMALDWKNAATRIDGDRNRYIYPTWRYIT